MHTFFINTSGKTLENYSDIFEIQHETRRLVSLDCALAEWSDENKGYQACVRKMGELIDSYKDINNDFNLIVYMDLLAYEKYTSIPMDKHLERYACLKALRAVTKHYIRSTLVEALNDCGRVPREVLLVFEENALPQDKDEVTDDGKARIRGYAQAFLGLPSQQEMDAFIYERVNDKNEINITAEQFCEKAETSFAAPVVSGLLHTYLDPIDTFLSEAKGRETCERALCALLERIVDLSDKDEKYIASVSFVTNRRAGVTNKQEKTRRNLRLCFYILSCIEDGTVYDKATMGGRSDPQPKAFPEMDWDHVVAQLAAKSASFQKKHKKTQQLSESFVDMQLAPPLLAFYHQKFGLDEYGKRGKTFDIVDVEEPEGQEQEEKEQEEAVIQPKGKKAMAVNQASGRNLFNRAEYQPFDYRGDDIAERTLSGKATTQQYFEAAQKLREHHLDYLQKLKVHVSDRLSNYAGRSAENDPALLRKRKVSVAEEDFEDTARDYQYQTPGGTKETKKLKTVEEISQTAYTSALLDYMEFCAGRSVAVKDVEEQCNWFVTRVHQIQESLKKIKLVAVGLLFALLILYMPFIVLQWEAITKNSTAIVVALLSVAVPVVVLYLIFGIAVWLQHRKCHKVWKEFKSRSAQVLEENAVAAEKYDQLLTVFVPTLRWVYEYRLDVEFYADCCKMARAKIGHHIQKLHDRVVTLGNIIEDLETDAAKRAKLGGKGGKDDAKIDYNVSFCSGDTNREFYAIIDTDFLHSVNK